MLLILAFVLVMIVHGTIKELTMTKYEKDRRERIRKARKAFDERMNQRG